MRDAFLRLTAVAVLAFAARSDAEAAYCASYFNGGTNCGFATFQQCLDSGKFEADIKKDVADAGAVGISGTPTFLIGVVQPGDGRVKVVKKLVGAKPYEEFKAAIDGMLAAP